MALVLDRIMMQDTTTKQWAALNKIDAVKDTWIDWGTGADQVSGADLPLADSGSFFSTDDVESALQQIAGLNFNTRKYVAGGVAVVLGNTTAALAAGQVPAENVANQATPPGNPGVLLGVSRIAAVLSSPAPGAALVVENRRILGIVVDAIGDPILMSTGEQVFYIYETTGAAGVPLGTGVGVSQIIFAYADGAGGWKAAGFPGASGNYYTWPVIRFDLMFLPEDAMIYGGGGAEALDNTPYSAGSGITISALYAISLSSLTADWDVGAYHIQALHFISDVATGSGAPFTVASTDKVTNLNADSVDDQHFIVGVAEKGDILYHDGTTWVNLVHGTSTQYLQSGNHGGIPQWATPAGTLPTGSVNHEILIWNGAAWVGSTTFFNVDEANGNTTIAGTLDVTGNVDASAGLDVDADNQKITVGAGADWEVVHNGTDTTMTSKTGDFIVDNTLATGSTIIRLGTDTAATDFQVQNDSGAAKLTITGAGQATFTGNVDATAGLDVSVAAFTFTGTTFDLDPTDNFTLDMDATKTATITLADNLDSAFLIQEGANSYLEIDTRNATEIVNFGNAVTNPDYYFIGTGTFGQGAGGGQVTFTGNVDATNGLDVSVAALTMTGTNIDLDPTGTFALDMDANQTITLTVADNLANTFKIQEGANMIMAVDSLNGTEKVDFGYNVNATSGLDVSGADLTVGGANFAVGTDGIVDAGTWQATSVKTNYGGTGLTAYTAGDMIYWAAGTAFTKLGIGTAFQILRTNAGATAPEWTSEGTVVSGAIVTKTGVTAKRLVSAFNDAGTGKYDMADASGQTMVAVTGVALSTVGAGAAVKLQTHGVVTCQLKSGFTSVVAGQIAYLTQAAGGYVAMYTDILYTSGRTILAVGVFLQTIASVGADTDILVALGAVGGSPVLVP